MATWSTIARMALPVGVSLFFLATPPQGRGAEDPGAKTEGIEHAPLPSPVKGAEAVATYYAKRYTGRKTASGERYRPEKLTAAHPHLPLGAKVRVTNLDNGRQVVVKVNDRCRKRRFPIIDLSRAAAEELGYVRKGRARVSIERLDEAPEPEVASAPPRLSTNP